MKKRMTISAVLAVSMVVVPSTMADVTFTLDFHFGAVDADGFLVATFADTATDVVTLTMDASNLQNDEYVSNWYFNFTDGLGLSESDFTHSSGVAGSLTVDPSGSGTLLKADGDGDYDFRFNFPNASGSRLGAPGGAGVAGSTSVYTISHTGLTSSDFNLFSEESGDQGTFLSAAHVQSTGSDGEGSDFLGHVPAPGAVLLGMIGLGMVGWVRRRFA